ncbi:hypothetical protein GCM10010420_08760 [Streptomyces glaucosporus]|uniref:Integral membrane protein n=1 Tax=Streptomyces glaucosporus TaxID=284044 RepID=A0ABN3HU92_9ACTN
MLLFIASFLAFFQAEDENCTGTCSFNTWEPAFFPLLPTVTIAGLAAAALLALGHMLPGERKVLGLGLDQWGTALAVFVGWSALWSTFSDLVPQVDTGYGSANDGVELGIGAWLTLIGGLVMAAFAILGNAVPALRAPLLPAPSPQAAPNPYGPGPQPGQPQPGGYGYPGGPQPGQPQPGGYGYPGGPLPGQHQPQPGQPQPGGYQPEQHQQPGQPQPPYGGQPSPAAGGAPADPHFQPFWFAVPVARPLFPEDGSPNPIAELAPGTWYLAVEQRGQALVAQTQDGRRGVLQDTSGIQRG